MRNVSVVRVQSCHCTRGGDGDDVCLKIPTPEVGEETSILLKNVLESILLKNVLEQELLEAYTQDLAIVRSPLANKNIS